MSYFSRFPVLVDYELGGSVYDVADITVRTGISSASKNDPNAYIPYQIQEGETALILADRIYGDPMLDWVILIFNDIIDECEGWPLSQQSLNEYVNSKYEDPFQVHHYISAVSGATVEKDHPQYDRVPISNFQHEENLNDSKRNIKILIPELVGEVVRQHHKLVSE